MESNPQPFGARDHAQPTEPHWFSLFFLVLLLKGEFHQEVQREKVGYRPTWVETGRGKGLSLRYKATGTQTLHLLIHIQTLSRATAIGKQKKSLEFAPRTCLQNPGLWPRAGYCSVLCGRGGSADRENNNTDWMGWLGGSWG